MPKKIGKIFSNAKSKLLGGPSSSSGIGSSSISKISKKKNQEKSECKLSKSSTSSSTSISSTVTTKFGDLLASSSLSTIEKVDGKVNSLATSGAKVGSSSPSIKKLQHQNNNNNNNSYHVHDFRGVGDGAEDINNVGNVEGGNEKLDIGSSDDGLLLSSSTKPIERSLDDERSKNRSRFIFGRLFNFSTAANTLTSSSGYNELYTEQQQQKVTR